MHIKWYHMLWVHWEVITNIAISISPSISPQPDQQCLWHLSYRTHAGMASSGNLTPGMPLLCNHKYLCSIGQVCVYNQCVKVVLVHYVHVWFTIGQGAKLAVNCAISGPASGHHCVHTVIIVCTLDYVPLVSGEKGGLHCSLKVLLFWGNSIGQFARQRLCWI